ncbi:DNA (cytosine-5-)-methyltransferase [Kineococcus sp. T13]|uniref:DNA cytosine methyltransferase n=1 Tax=Kineococcus vitellinus TaxID=2696565 RepID=UPI0014123352|nr:DNA cytosine methyltransferase [Kineococcus vitellinus]NAZ74027.1 DNA (cytosine-5-)-methyltransferase [Kineococcus vitellinus]
MTDRIPMIDLFAGCGGMSLGFRDHGFASIMAVEHDISAASTYATNFSGSHVHAVDIATIDDEDIPREARVIIGGPPCQGFSNLGSKDVDDPRNKLWKQYLRFVQVAQPDVFVLENVQRFQKSSEFALLQAEAHHGMLRDYRLNSALLLAADFGVPQRRPRTVVIGSRKEISKRPLPMPTPTHGRDEGFGIQPWVTVKERWAEVTPEVSRTTLPEGRTTDILGTRLPGAYSAADIHVGRVPTHLSLARYMDIPEGGNRFDIDRSRLSDCWLTSPTGHTDVMGRMRWNEPSLTIRTEFFKPEKGRYLHPDQHRPITHLEAALLQDFPMSFQWVGSKVSIARQIGNAVPRGLAAALARHVKHYLD